MAERGLNQVSLIGRLGKDAEQRWTQSGKSVSNFSLAIGSSFKTASGEWQDKTEWINCVLWGSENLIPYLAKGSRIHVQGRIQTRKWQDQGGNDRYSTEVVCENVLLLGDGSGGQSDSAPRQDAPAQRQPPARQQPAARRPPPARQAPPAEDFDDDFYPDSVPF